MNHRQNKVNNNKVNNNNKQQKIIQMFLRVQQKRNAGFSY